MTKPGYAAIMDDFLALKPTCAQSFFAGTALRCPSMTSRSTKPGANMSWRKRSCCSNSSARSVGPGWLRWHDQKAGGVKVLIWRRRTY